MTMSEMGAKSPPMLWEKSMPGDKIGGDETKGECTSCIDGAAPMELDGSVLMSSMVIYDDWETMPAEPKPSKISTSQPADSGAACNIGLTRLGRISWTLMSSSGAKRCSPTRRVARMLAIWCRWSRGLTEKGLPDDGIMDKTSVRSLVMLRRDSI